jgi:hypothetical protein
MDDRVNAPGPYDVRIIEDRWATFRHIIEALAIVAAGLWAFYTFIYTERIKPQYEPATAQFTTAFDRGHARGSIDESTFTITATNTGHTDIDIVAEVFTVFGERLGTVPQKTVEAKIDEIQDDRTLPVAQRSLIATSGLLRDGAVTGRKGDHVILRPGEHFDYRLPLSWPRGRYDDLNLEYQFVIDRYPLAKKIDVRFVRRADGSIDLQGHDFIRSDVQTDYFL